MANCPYYSATNPEVSAALAPKVRTLVVTLGSALRADDGVGPFIAGLVKFTKPAFRLIDAGTTPENIAHDAINFKPDKIIIIDAARFGGSAGELAVIPLEKISQHTVISTHSFPLGVIFSIIKQDTGAELAVIGVQPKSLDYAEGLCPEVRDSALKLANYFNTIGKAIT
ncbi:MAG: hydrogenase 3 maturation endopeptidase HyCI [Elusimicrobia bacterium]|nr:hydrogenase 3 maturation endopeptidase HyCI [Elusimicrobiota bacterium]